MVLIKDLSGHISPVIPENIKCKCSFIFTLSEFTHVGNRHRLDEQGSIYIACPKCKQVYSYTFKSPENPSQCGDVDINLYSLGENVSHTITYGVPVKNMADFMYVDFSDDKIIIEDDYVVIIYNGGRRYEIKLTRIQDESSLIRWIHHLLMKRWFTKKHVKEFIKVVSDENGFDLYGGD